jgi:hypothetical protein
MSERLTDPDTGRPLPPTPHRAAGSGEVRGSALYVVAVLAAYAVAGCALGWVWFQLWTPESGQVFKHQWYASGDALRGDFSGTALYVLLAAGGGAVVGLGAAFTGGRWPVLTLVTAVAGSLMAGLLMMHLGESLGPADPATLAAHAKDGTKLPSALRVTGLSPQLAFSLGTLAAVGLVFTVFPGKVPKYR